MLLHIRPRTRCIAPARASAAHLRLACTHKVSTRPASGADRRSRVTCTPHAQSLPLRKMAMASLALSAVRPTAGSILTYRPRKTELYLMLSGPSIKSSSSSATHDRILTCRAQANYEKGVGGGASGVSADSTHACRRCEPDLEGSNITLILRTDSDMGMPLVARSSPS
jgi:hypothetical protein